jgi:hypothetical protein
MNTPKTLAEHDIIKALYHPTGELRLTMTDVLRLFTDRPEIQHFDDLRRLHLLPELESRILAYSRARGVINYGPHSNYSLTTTRLLGTLAA